MNRVYNAEAIAGQLKVFIQSSPQIQAGERKLLVDALIERVEIGENKRVVALLRPPLPSFGYFSPSLALGESNPKQAKYSSCISGSTLTLSVTEAEILSSIFRLIVMNMYVICIGRTDEGHLGSAEGESESRQTRCSFL
jgi:hypothetical protein